MYLSLARKYRPKSFDEVVGQGHIVLTLKNAIKLNRINSAYLFFGPRGTGKTSIARILAKSLNCKEGPTPLCCCKCSSCIEIDESSSLDVLEIDGASNRGIDQIRELRESVSYKAIGGGYKVYIIDEVHMLTIEAFNALLKTLEEPPPQVIFIFATTEVQKVPKTISSRTQMFEFRKIEKTVIEEVLNSIVKKENFNIKKEAISLISLISDGSLRDSEAILDQVGLYNNDANCDDIRRLLGICKEETIILLIEMIRKKDMNAMQYVEKMMQDGFSSDMIIKGLLNSFRYLIVEAAEKNDDVEWLIKAADVFCETQERIKRLPDDIELLLETAIIKLIQGEVKSQESGVGRRREEIGRNKKETRSQELEIGNWKLEIGNSNQGFENKEEFPKEANLQSPIPNSQFPLPTSHSDLWKDVLEMVGKKKPLLKNPLLGVESIKLDTDKITISFKINTHRRIIEKEENKRAIEEMASEIFKKKINIEVKGQGSRVRGQEDIVKVAEEKRDIVDVACDIFRGVE